MPSSPAIDFGRIRRDELNVVDLAEELTAHELVHATNEICDLHLALIADALDEDVVFVPSDPEANDTFASDPSVVGLPWTLGHVAVHTTASAEESAFLVLGLARGIAPDGRSRYEVPWEVVESIDFVRHRIQESRRMRLAMLDAWPDHPDLRATYRPYATIGPMNAVARFLLGLSHDDSHTEQLREIMVQARAAR
jgi:hypothetical protein